MKALKISTIETPLGPMVAIADKNALFLLEFVDRKACDQQIVRLSKKLKMAIVPGKEKPIESIEEELQHYFKGTLHTFCTPLSLQGSPFQTLVWNELGKIPYGQTNSYSELATAIGKPTAFRAVAMANSTNRLAIIVPCHRVIHINGTLAGYAGGIEKKQWLLEHEKKSAL